MPCATLPEPCSAHASPESLLRRGYEASSGHWRSGLSPSALAAATAASAFQTALTAPKPSPGIPRPELEEARNAACDWILRHQNHDGGWGDTPDSPSNLSTTLLAWSALQASHRGTGDSDALDQAAHWLARTCGGPLDPERISDFVTATYGEDRTFSVPILLTCAVNGVLGHGAEAWSKVAPLPCELALLPHALFRFLRMGVVSYALPALIAVGLCRNRKATSRSIRILLRRGLTRALLRRLESLQPGNGGFLEAVPLSAFVALSLCSCGLGDHPVAERALRFLLDARRATDGAWAIDSNLDTWVTSLAVQALGSRERITECLQDPDAPDAILSHLLATQFRTIHPYTQARPGGWAWTDLPGAVPDADDTCGALVALSILCPAGHPRQETTEAAARSGLKWIAGIQNTDGGIPTFCRGWGRLPFDRSAPDLTAHAVEALDAWIPRIPPREGSRLRSVRHRALRYLLRTQSPEGLWNPLWFGSQSRPDGSNPVFGTARVLQALQHHRNKPGARQALHRGREALRALQNPDGSWGKSLDSATGTAEETGMALCALPAGDPARVPAENWIRHHLEEGVRSNPIGLYFTRLWYSETLYPALWLTASRRAGPHTEAMTPPPTTASPLYSTSA